MNEFHFKFKCFIRGGRIRMGWSTDARIFIIWCGLKNDKNVILFQNENILKSNQQHQQQQQYQHQSTTIKKIFKLKKHKYTAYTIDIVEEIRTSGHIHIMLV